MAPRVLPKFPWMSAPWVANARQIAYERAQLPEYKDGLASEDFIFAEEFRNPPKCKCRSFCAFSREGRSLNEADAQMRHPMGSTAASSWW